MKFEGSSRGFALKGRRGSTLNTAELHFQRQHKTVPHPSRLPLLQQAKAAPLQVLVSYLQLQQTNNSSAHWTGQFFSALLLL